MNQSVPENRVLSPTIPSGRAVATPSSTVTHERDGEPLEQFADFRSGLRAVEEFLVINRHVIHECKNAARPCALWAHHPLELFRNVDGSGGIDSYISLAFIGSRRAPWFALHAF